MVSFSQFLKESSPAFRLLEGKKEYLAKFAGKSQLVPTVDMFWDVVRKRVAPPYNDIGWWMNRPFEEFKDYVDGFDTRNRSDRRASNHVEVAKQFGAKKIGEKNGWEAWYVPSYEAARELGRFYMGTSADWCISTDNASYFNDDYERSEFVFLIWARDRRGCPDQDWLKVAIQRDRVWWHGDSGDYRIRLWSLSDEEFQDDDAYLTGEKAASLRQAVDWVTGGWAGLVGTDRERYRDDLIKKYAADTEWLRTNVFQEQLSFRTFRRMGDSVSCEVPLSCLEDVIDSKAGVGYDFIRDLFSGDDFNLFSFDRLDGGFDIPADAEKAFDEKMKETGLTWKDVASVGQGGTAGLPSAAANTISEMLDGDFYEGNSYSTVYADCQRSGTRAEAREDIEGQLYTEMDVTGIGHSAGGGITMKCLFDRYDVKKMVEACLELGKGETPLYYFRYDVDSDEVDRYAVEEPQEGWNGFDDGMMKEAVLGFADSLKGELARQKDAPGQMTFGFDKDYLDNPRNLERGRK